MLWGFKIMTRSGVAAWIVAGVLAVAPGNAGDLIRPVNSDPSENGVLVDGSRHGIQINDQRYRELDLGGLFNALFPVIPLENYLLGPDSNEVLVFSRGHPPRLVENVPWTPFSDTIDVELEDEYRITVYVWIVHEDALNSALNGNVATSAIWRDERQGVAFEEFVVTPAWEDPDAANFYDFSCFMASDMRAQIGYNPAGVNIYYVSQVYDSTTSGVWCGNATIAMGKNTSGHLLAHELGHSLGLQHSNQSHDANQFDQTNVMHNASNERQYLTEGQTYRAVFKPSSVLNNVYDVREDQLTRNCPLNSFDFVCPKIYRRIWPDGPSWPQN